MRESGLPTPTWNPRLSDAGGRFIAVSDAWFDEVALAWEIDSREWHLSPQDHDRTLDRRTAMTARGIWVVHTQPSKLKLNPAAVLADLRSNYAQAALRPRPPVHATPP